MTPVYEVVSGQILLSQKRRFFSLHGEVLLPMMREIGIAPVLLLVTELGRYCRFLDIYKYNSLAHYEELTDRLISNPRLDEYYADIARCINGEITVEIMRESPYGEQ